jgi:pimeloyl-ACP methyl ester carboxylesterase
MQLSPQARSKAAAFAIYAASAEEVFPAAEAAGEKAPPLDGSPLEVAWQCLWQFRADDDTYWVQHLRNLLGVKEDNLYYGLLLRCTQALPDIGYKIGDLLVIIRGTETDKEWLLNFNAVAVPCNTVAHPQGGLVHDGFYSIYRSLAAWDDKGDEFQNAAALLAEELRPDGPQLTVVGHSLGAALVSYLIYDIADAVRTTGGDIAGRLSRLNAYMFASPNPGDPVFVQGLQAAVPSYAVIDWSRDVVPKVPPIAPPLFPFAHLQAAPAAQTFDWIAEADVTWMPIDSPTCNHSTVCYARMLDPLNAISQARSSAAKCDPANSA